MRLFVKNLLCNRCRKSVIATLTRLGICFEYNEPGELIIKGQIPRRKKEKLLAMFREFGFEFTEDRKIILAEKIKNVIIEMVQTPGDHQFLKFSDFLSKKLNYGYHYLSNIFSEITDTTIEQFIITTRIGFAKQLLITKHLSLSQIANQLNYRSVAHLSSQFKKTTGVTPTSFKAGIYNKI